jgi:hypothetical protein
MMHFEMTLKLALKNDFQWVAMGCCWTIQGQSKRQHQEFVWLFFYELHEHKIWITLFEAPRLLEKFRKNLGVCKGLLFVAQNVHIKLDFIRCIGMVEGCFFEAPKFAELFLAVYRETCVEES